MTNDEKIVALRATKKRLKAKGWCQKGIGPSTGPNCLWGALDIVCAPNESLPVVVDLRKQIKNPPLIFDIAYWNDQEGRTVEDVYALIDKTIKYLIKTG